MSAKSVLGKVADRTAVLFIGVALGAAIGYAFAAASGSDMPAPAAAAAKPVVATTAPKAAECATPFQSELLATVEDGGKVRVGVFGDSFGDGLWAALYHQLPAKDGFQVEKFSQQSTGFTRYASLNLETHLAEQLAGKRVDIAVITYGANDTQGVMHNGKVAALLSPAWKAEIGARISRYVGALRKKGAVVYWVGLPVMRKPSFDADISGMNDFYAEQMDKLGVPFIETRSLSVDSSGAYAAYLPDPRTGEPRLMRANDGIHMSMGGYARLTGGLAERIRRYISAARAQAEGKDGQTPPVSAAAGAEQGSAPNSGA